MTAIETPRAPMRWVWLSNPTLILFVAAVLLPNALSLGALVAGIGTPPRTTAIVAYATIALTTRVLPSAVVAGLYVCVAIYDAIATIALLFNLAPSEIGLALHLSADLHLFASPLYIVLVVAALGVTGANLAMLTLMRPVLSRGNAVVALAAALSFAAVDFLANTSPYYEFGTLYSAGKPMESATEASGFRKTMLATGQRNALLVMVEALGEFADPAKQAVLLRALHEPDLLRRYKVTTGSTTYYGSTTAAEMRELCNTREPYQSILEGKHIDCLPADMAARGYRTISLHNFTGGFFNRADWYPKIGFQQRIFGEQVIGKVHRLCGGPFRGPCDVDMIPLIGEQLRNADNPTFVYWMTLSTHVPIAPHEGSPRLSCRNHGGVLGQMEVCYMTELWIDVLQGIARMSADIPPTDILLVGDHAPPMWSKAARHLFTPGKVTWVRLTPRQGGAQASSLP